jgi:hypothetical protein
LLQALALALLAAFPIAGCSHASSSNHGLSALFKSGAAVPRSQSSAGPMAQSEQSGDDRWRIAEIASARLGGGRPSAAVEVTGVSIVGKYGLTVYSTGSARGEALFLKQHSEWRVLGSNGFDPGGRGLLHFGLSPDLARSLIAGLEPPPASQNGNAP